jgi:hypothetical protein
MITKPFILAKGNYRISAGSFVITPLDYAFVVEPGVFQRADVRSLL